MKTQPTPIQIAGKVIEIGETQSGENWKRAHLVVNTISDKYPKDVFISVWGDTINQLERIRINDHVVIKFNVSSRKHEDRWYTELQAWRIDVDFHAMRNEQQGGNQ